MRGQGKISFLQLCGDLANLFLEVLGIHILRKTDFFASYRHSLAIIRPYISYGNTTDTYTRELLHTRVYVLLYRVGSGHR